MYKCQFIVFMYNYTCKYECTPSIDKYKCGKNNKCSQYKKEGRGIVKNHSKIYMFDKKNRNTNHRYVCKVQYNC